jgi:hypothetical protein
MNHIPAKYRMLFFALLFSGSAFSQQPDTIVVYEYIYKTDTVWVESQPTRDTTDLRQLQNVDDATLIIDTTNNKTELVIFSSGKRATIPINRIILDGNQNQPEMKKITFLGLTILAISSTVNAQNGFSDRIGFYLKGNAVTQVYKRFDDSDKYYTAEEIRPSLGFGIKYEHNLNKTFSVVGNLGYLQRGCYQSSYKITYFYQDGRTEEKTIAEKVNRFHNINLDALLKISVRKNKVINPYLYTGLRGDFTVAKSIEYEIERFSPIGNSSYTGFHAFNFGVVSGFGVDFNKRIFLEFELNNDLGYLLKNDVLRVKNLMGSITLGFYLDKIPHHNAAKKDR